MKFDWHHYMSVQLQWAESLLARSQETECGDADDLIAIARDRLHDLARLSDSVYRGGDGLRTCH